MKSSVPCTQTKITVHTHKNNILSCTITAEESRCSMQDGKYLFSLRASFLRI